MKIGQDIQISDGIPSMIQSNFLVLRLKIDECYKGFTLRLRSIYSISDMELKICLLLKIGVGVTGIALLCGRTKSAIVSARKRLYEKFFAQKGRPEDWDEFILSL